MLISRKLTKGKRVVTDFRHLNVRIAKQNFAYPLLKDTFSVLGCSKCEVLSVLDLKDAFHSLKLYENSKKYCSILPYLAAHHTYIRGCLWDYTYPPPHGNPTSMLSSIVYRARNIGNPSWMTFYCLHHQKVLIWQC